MRGLGSEVWLFSISFNQIISALLEKLQSNSKLLAMLSVSGKFDRDLSTM